MLRPISRIQIHSYIYTCTNYHECPTSYPAWVEKTPFGPPHCNNEVIKIQMTLVFQKLLLFSVGGNCWEILYRNYAYWSTDLRKSISYYVLVVFVATLCWSPLLNVHFQSGSRPLCARLQPTMFQAWLYCTSWTNYSHSQYSHTKLWHMFLMNIRNVNAWQRQTHHIWVKSCYFMSVSNKLYRLFVNIILCCRIGSSYYSL